MTLSVTRNAIAALFISLPIAGFSQTDDDTTWTNSVEMEDYRMSLYRAHRECASSAVAMMLSYDVVKACSENFLKLKLSFLRGATLERYLRASPPTRAVANEKGYAAYRAWLHRHIAMGGLPQ